jgi:hypothetical protein
MAESVYKVIELIGTSTVSWEKAAAAAVKLAAGSLRELRVAEVSELDMNIVGGKIVSYRAKVKVSFKYLSGSDQAEPESAPSPAPAKRAAKRGRRKG